MKVKQPTPFYELAEKIANGTPIKTSVAPVIGYSSHRHDDCFVCSILDYADMIKERDYFISVFLPLNADPNAAFMSSHPWVCGNKVSFKKAIDLNNSHRIIALLFADLMWRDEYKSTNP